jgi:hypothetical protein
MANKLTGYALVNLKDLIENVGEDRAKEILSAFSCPQNKDVEDFLRFKAREFSRQGIAQTHLVFTSFQELPVLIGYFTLANKTIVLPKKNLSTKWCARAKRFSVGYNIDGAFWIPAPLIAQLGKNFTNGYNDLITGDELLKLALDRVREAQAMLGGKFVYLECEDKDKLVSFYEENGFVEFGKRSLERDERDTQTGEYLIQLLKYLD